MAILDQNYEWHFAKIEGGGDQGPRNAAFEYFKNMYESLVREAIQNSLDAHDDSGNSVVVNFSFKGIPCNNFKHFFGIRKHIEGCLTKYNSEEGHERFDPMINYLDNLLSQVNGKMDYLEVSDENTIGMNYNFNDQNAEECGRFYAFLKAVGVDDKGGSETAGGAFGFGKAAFFNVSTINTLLVSTKTMQNGSEKDYFEGVSRLCTHVIDGNKYVDTGFFCNAGDKHERPITNNIPARFMRSKIGTSISVMGLDFSVISRDKAIEQIIKAVLFNFWLAIIEKRLIVNVNIGNANQQIIDINTLDDLMDKYYPEIGDGSSKNNPRPYFEAVRHAEEDNRYKKTEKVLPELGKVRFYLFKNKNAVADRYIFMRKELMYINYKKNNTNFGFFGVLVVDGEAANKILRHCEDATHHEWKEKNCRKPEHKEKAKVLLNDLSEFIESIIKDNFKTSSSTRVELIGIDHYLYIPTAEEEDGEDNNQSTLGNNSHQESDNGASPTTNLMTPKTDSINFEGKAYLPVRTRASQDSHGNLGSGHGNGHEGKHHNPNPADLTQRNSEDKKGKEGVYGSVVPVYVNTYAQEENNVIYHYVVLHKKDTPLVNGRIVLYSAGEQKSERIKINQAWINNNSISSQIENNCIRGLNMEQSIKIKIKFNDNLQHSLKVRAYEK